MRNADVIADWLAEKGITTAYGIVGGGNHVIFDAIAKKGGCEIVCCHHEQAAAMASTYHNRVVGGIGSVCLVTTGAGSTNAITGVMAAWMDSIPLLVLSGNEASKYMQAPTRVWGVQGYASAELVGRCTKFVARMVAGDIRMLLEAGYGHATTPREGPVWLDIPKDVQAMEATDAV